MPATNFTPIQLFHSSTSGTLPTTSQLFTGEVFWNIADNKVYGLNTAGTALQTIVGSLGNQNANTVAITGGSINGTTIGATTPSAGAFTTLTASTSVLSPIVGAGTGSNLSLQANETTYATLDTSGNLGLGVIPSVWGSNYTAFQFNDTGTLYGTHASTFIGLGSNFYINSSSTSIYYASDFATNYVQGAGTHSWYTAPSGTAGNTITFTQAMTLDNSGNLLVGTTSSPSGSGNIKANNIVFAQLFQGLNTFSVPDNGTAVSFGASGFFHIHGAIPNNEFHDIVVHQSYGSTAVIGSATIGSPPTRTYSDVNGSLGISLSGGTSGTYPVTITVMGS